jgi:hypothetical protein
MFCGAVFLLADAMPHEESQQTAFATAPDAA